MSAAGFRRRRFPAPDHLHLGRRELVPAQLSEISRIALFQRSAITIDPSGRATMPWGSRNEAPVQFPSACPCRAVPAIVWTAIGKGGILQRHLGSCEYTSECRRFSGLGLQQPVPGIHDQRRPEVRRPSDGERAGRVLPTGLGHPILTWLALTAVQLDSSRSKATGPASPTNSRATLGS